MSTLRIIKAPRIERPLLFMPRMALEVGIQAAIVHYLWVEINAEGEMAFNQDGSLVWGAPPNLADEIKLRNGVIWSKMTGEKVAEWTSGVITPPMATRALKKLVRFKLLRAKALGTMKTDRSLYYTAFQEAPSPALQAHETNEPIPR